MRIPRAGFVLALLLACAGGRTTAQPVPVSLVAPQSRWALFPGRSEPSPTDRTAWRAQGFHDATWTQAAAPFWYGEAALFGDTGTQLAEMQNSYSTLFLRRTFTVLDPAAFESLRLRAICDDGFRAWINGTPVASLNPPAGEPAFNSIAGANIPEPIAWTDYFLSAGIAALRPGENVLAVQVFNVSQGSSDLAFDAELIATVQPLGPPTVVNVSPAPGPVTALDRITVTFSEPVQGIRAEDFLVNGASATGVQGSASTYTFTFAHPPYGAVEISWSTFHTITDLESPPRAFEIASPGSTWGYELIDPDGPSLLQVHPPRGTTLRSFQQVEVTFNKAVAGLDAADLLANGLPASSVSGIGAGPYLFTFPTRTTPEPVQLQWAPAHAIVSDAFEPHPFTGGAWTYGVDPGTRIPALVITEFMAENWTSHRDEDQDPEDWIEIWNPTTETARLEGWSLTHDDDAPSEWVFPAVTLAPGARLVVFASGKDRRPATVGARLHTGFKLNPTGDYLGLYSPELPRQPVSEVRYPAQGPDHSWGRDRDTGDWRYYKGGTPGAPNGSSTIRDAVAPVHFSVTRGFFDHPFRLHLHTPTLGATIRFTTDGSPPTDSTGLVYTDGIQITTNRVIRAAAFRSNALPSRVETHTYLIGLPAARLRLPALSLVTATNHLYGRNGIMEVNPRNTTRRGAAWERPVSAEWIRVEDNGGFQVDCGLRLQGGDYVRGQYNYRSTSLPFSKYSFRLYFRGEYGQGRLEYPLFPETTQRSFDTIVLRAGMNDHSNPYIIDEFVRTLARDCGQPSAVGTFVHLFLNGVYKGYYNPCERIDVDFLRAYHGGGETWDVMAQNGEVREGDATAWNTLRNLINTRDLSLPANYRDIAGRLDLTNFIDYLCPLIYVDNDDWPHNNWRAARERVPGGLYRFYVWDAEWAFGFQNGHSPTWDTIRNQLSSTSPPWGSADIQRMFNGLRKAPEFRLLFADRAHRHFFNGGPLTDENIRARYTDVTNRLNRVITGFNNRIGTTWIPQRRRNVLLHLERAGLMASSNAPALSQHGGRIQTGFALTLTNLQGTIFYTTNGADPRVAFTGEVSPEALTYTAPLPLTRSVVLRARSLAGTNWSALSEAAFEAARVEPALQISELMPQPQGGDAFEFLELANTGDLPLDLSGYSLSGVTFRFPMPSPPMAPGAHWILANNNAPSQFTARYPGVVVAGWFGGSLNNAGERIEVLDRDGRVVTSATYGSQPPWPSIAGNLGSLERIAPDLDPADAAAWTLSADPAGSPGLPNPPPQPQTLRLSEVVAVPAPAADWVEIENLTGNAVALAGWSLSDGADPRRFVFPPGSQIDAGARLRVWMGTNTVAGAWNTGFSLAASGETLALYSPAGARADAVSFAFLPEGYSLGRVGSAGQWNLCEPTPEAPNEPASSAAPASAVINEWLANPPSGGDDWIEVHNRHATLPLALRGLHVATSNALATVRTHVFIPPGGFVTLIADEGPGAAHLDLRLPAIGGSIALLDPTGIVLDTVTYKSVEEGLSWGRLPDGAESIVAFPGSATPGRPNRASPPPGPRINEFMARNQGAVPAPDGSTPDWLEVHNPESVAHDLGGSVLSVGNARWTFPAPMVLGAGAYLVLKCDSSRPPSTLPPFQTGFDLPGNGAEIRWSGRDGMPMDTVRYGPQLPNQSAGVSLGTWTLQTRPTPGAANAGAAALGAPDGARLNEWLAGDTAGADWIEIFNPGPLPLDLGGCFVTDDPSRAGRTKSPLPPLSFVDAGAQARFWADGVADQGPDHLGLRLSAAGEALRLYTPGQVLVDGVDFGWAPAGVAAGRFPDGAATLVRFPDSASPGAANWRPHPSVVISELLTHADPPLEDAIELHNPSTVPVSLAGWYLSDDPANPRKVRLHSLGTLAPGDYQVIYETQFRTPAQPAGFTLDAARGGEIWLSEADVDGNLTGRRAHAAYGALARGQSLGRHRTSAGWDLAPMSRRTFGMDAPTTLEEFRQGQGLPNPYPLVGPVVITELQVRPGRPTADGFLEDPNLEFVELFNDSSQRVSLFDEAAPTNTWRLRGAVAFDFPRGLVLEPGQYALLLPFPPSDSAALAAFQSRHVVPETAVLLGPFQGRLANEGEDIRLERPDAPRTAPGRDAGFVPWLLVERIRYDVAFPWPALQSTPGHSLQRRRAAVYANEPSNWLLAEPSPGRSTPPPSTDRDLDGLPNDWETRYGLNPDDPQDAAADLDGDGLSNLAEFLAGTDPRSAASALLVDITTAPSTGPMLRFQALADRTYSVVRRSDLATGTWEWVSDIWAEPFDREVLVPLDRAKDGGFLRVTTPALPDGVK